MNPADVLITILLCLIIFVMSFFLILIISDLIKEIKMKYKIRTKGSKMAKKTN